MCLAETRWGECVHCDTNKGCAFQCGATVSCCTRLKHVVHACKCSRNAVCSCCIAHLASLAGEPLPFRSGHGQQQQAVTGAIVQQTGKVIASCDAGRLRCEAELPLSLLYTLQLSPAALCDSGKHRRGMVLVVQWLVNRQKAQYSSGLTVRHSHVWS